MVSAGYSFLSSGAKELFFGLGPAEKADRVVVRWPSGRVTERRDVPAGRLNVHETADP
ncbi:MAG TPA: ASPIC/UnbV domain-containing protein [Thermoanaerobaculia bacterium]|nr:ASPIC/UnbV domain-containing protein [Thermoanaerobaculia bacterium]